MVHKHTRREFLRAAGLSAAAISLRPLAAPGAPAAASASAPDAPANFLILYADDMGWGDVGCNGATDVRTPNLDALAASGIRFTNWYSNAPVCSASRAALLTGRYPMRAGAPGIFASGRQAPGMPPSEVTLAEILGGAGYRTGLVGKWHLGGAPEMRPNRQGFRDFFGFHSGCIDYYSHIYYWGQGGPNGRPPFHDLWRNDTEIWEDGQYFTDLVTRESTAFLRARAKSSPAERFFLYVAFNAPHYPLHAPARYFDRFTHIADPQRRSQAAMVAAVDDAIGEIVRALREIGLYQNTAIFFSSDNGPSAENRNLLDDSGQLYHGGSAGPYRGNKFDLYEGGLRVPAIFTGWFDRFSKGRATDEIGVTMDILPTFASLAVNPPGDRLVPKDRVIDGRDLTAVVRQGAASPHRDQPVFWSQADQRAVRLGNWKLILNARESRAKQSAAPGPSLFDLQADPYETANLAGRNPDRVKEMEALITHWNEDVSGKKAAAAKAAKAL